MAGITTYIIRKVLKIAVGINEQEVDAHHPEQLAFIELGLAAAALKAKIDAEKIINFKDARTLRRLFRN
jgi:histidinol phosphatase-like PHP family hydrolase